MAGVYSVIISADDYNVNMLLDPCAAWVATPAAAMAELTSRVPWLVDV